MRSVLWDLTFTSCDLPCIGTEQSRMHTLLILAVVVVVLVVVVVVITMVMSVATCECAN